MVKKERKSILNKYIKIRVSNNKKNNMIKNNFNTQNKNNYKIEILIFTYFL